MSDEEAEVIELDLTKASDLSADDIFYKILVFGQSGAGKTHLASLADDCLLIPLEAQAIPTVRQASKTTLLPFGDKPVTRVEQLYEIMRQAKSGNLAEAGIKTLVIDSLTELQRLLMDDIKNNKGKNKGVFTKADWGTLSNRMHQFLRMLRDLPFNVIVIALSDVNTADDTRRITPALKGGIKHELAGYFNAIGYAYKVRLADDGERGTDAAEVRHLVMFEAGEEYLVKPFGQLTGVVIPDPSAWFKLLDGDESVNLDPDSKSSRPSAGEKKGKPRGKPRAARKTDEDDDDDNDDGENANQKPGSF